jgi:predicted HD phosphohydrolase
MDPKYQASEKFMAFLSDIFERGTSMSYGAGEVSMCSHMLQTACFAEEDGASPELIAASLMHDIGHFGTDFSIESNENRHKAMLSVTKDRYHEEAGANLLEKILGVDVAEPVRLHVSAKRYLCAVDPKYYENLAETTRHTLKLQGGIMTLEEVHIFESNVHSTAAAKLRRWDDLATHQERKIPSFGHYQKLLEDLL